MLQSFENWLLEQEYKSSTATDYALRLDRLCRKEKFSFEYLAQHLTEIMPQYEKNGKKHAYGKRSHSSVLSALKRFAEFLNEDGHNVQTEGFRQWLILKH